MKVQNWMAGAMISFMCVTCISCGRTSSSPEIVRSVISPKDGCVYHGAFLSDTITDAEIKYFEDMSGKNLDIVLKFLAFSAVESGDGFPLDEANIVSANGGVMFIKLEPWAWDPSSDPYPLSGIASGAYDESVLRKFALKAKEYGKPVFVSFGHEMNAAWYPWGQQPDAYIKAYKHVYGTVNSYTNNITWVWNPNIDYSSSGYYPGSYYVDWIAVDGYNTMDWGAWRSVEGLFSSAVSEIEAYGKPVMIGETACDANSDVDEQINKPNWLYEGISWICGRKKSGSGDNLIKAFVYFNKDKNEDGMKKWAISYPEAKSKYKKALSDLSSFFKGL